MARITRLVAAASLLAMIASVGAFGTLPAVADEIQSDPSENSLVSDQPSQVDLPEPVPVEEPSESVPADDEIVEVEPTAVVTPEPGTEATQGEHEAVAPAGNAEPSVAPPVAAPWTGHLVWHQQTPGINPSYVGLWAGAPLSQVSDCAAVDDPAIHGDEYVIPYDPANPADFTVAFDLIQWTVTQNTGSATFDVASSECGARWGITANDPMYVDYDPLQVGDAARAASVSFGPGTITIDVDALRLAGEEGVSLNPGPINVVRSDGLIIGITMWISGFADDEPETGSCFEAGPPPADGLYELPALPEPYHATVAVGDAVRIAAADLVKDSAWTLGFVNDISGLAGSAIGEPTEAGDNFSWTATAAGVHTFEYVLATPYCMSEARIGTITVAAAPGPIAPAASPVVPDRLALTGSDSFPVIAWATIALILGAGFVTLHHVGRRHTSAERKDN